MMKFVSAIIIFFYISLKGFAQIPEGFVHVKDEIPSIQVELRYYSNNNFVGQPIDGYEEHVLIVSKMASEFLKLVQQELKSRGLGLKVFDAYRPQRAVNHFWKWALDVNDTLMKHRYYPNVDKKNLFNEGYIASKSSHTRGSTLDVTLVDLETGKEIDMGTPFDFFGPESWVLHEKLTIEQKWNRQQLQKVMLKHGFKNYPLEWWHFTLKDEPFPNTYFNFSVE